MPTTILPEYEIKNQKICYPYITAAICKVAHAPSVLRYTEEKLFLDGSAGSMVSDVEFGFVYPSINDNKPDLSEALVYAKQGHLFDDDDLLHDIFNTNAPMDSSTKNEELGGVPYILIQAENCAEIGGIKVKPGK